MAAEYKKTELVLPHNDDAEKSVLGAAMLDPEQLGDILEEVKPEDFYNEAHAEICKAVLELYRDNKPVDMLTVCEELQRRNSLDMVGGRGYVAMLTSDVPYTANAVEYAKIVNEKAMLRQLIKLSQNITDKGYRAEDDAREILNFAEEKILNIALKKQKNDYSPIQDVLRENVIQIEENAKIDGEVIGLPTGFKGLDAKTHGLQKSALVIVAARPAMGKTAFALNLALNAAIKGDASVLLFNFEMDKKELGMRFLAMQARIESNKLKTGKLDPQDWDRLSYAIDELGKTKIHIDDVPKLSIMEIRNKCRRLKASKGLDLIVIDYLQLMESESRTESRLQEISKITRELKQLAREMECPVIVLSQLSRKPDDRPDHRPLISDLRESGSIEQDADVVFLLYRDEYYNPNTDKPGVCEVTLAKHRAGETGTVELTWVPQYTKFTDQAY